NNEMDDFVQKPGAANAYGLVGTEANAVAPGKRPLSSMSPTLLLRDGKVFMAVGGSGGPQIISSTLQVIVNVVDFGMSARAAVEAPRIHHQWLPDELWVEPEVARDVGVNLEPRSHKVRSEALYSAVQVVVVDLKSGRRSAASDPRKLGAPSAQPSVGASTPKK
ncbi:MAG: gamma-glutamyltransferase, partial [Deltaproteobacteria bacterium CG17_big_fil_post_rev_8_21_14_2_50_63_7]